MGTGKSGGARRDRTADLYNAIVALSQLSYGPLRRAQSREERSVRSTVKRRGVPHREAAQSAGGADCLYANNRTFLQWKASA
jgi:hypothetical protein